MSSFSINQFSRLNLILLVALGSILVAIYWIPVSSIAMICWTDDDYSHGLILPLVMLYMWWDRKSQILESLKLESNNNTKGENLLFSLFFFIGLLNLGLAVASKLSFFSWISLFPLMAGLIGLIFGRKFFSSFIGPFLLLYMAKPLPDSVVVRLFWPLQVLAAKIGALTLQALNVPVYLSGNIIEIPNMKLLVEEACSGMRSVMALLTLSFIMIYFSSLNYLGKIVLVISSLALAVALNVFRVSLTGVLAHFYDPDAATGFFHEFSGLLVFVVGLPFLFAAANFFSRIKLTKK
jgi:exosortase